MTILLEEQYGWRRVNAGSLRAWIKGDVTDDAVRTILCGLPPDADDATLGGTLAALHGHFAIVVRHAKWACAAVDRVRSIPIAWMLDDGGRVFVAEGGRRILAAVGRRLPVDPDQALAVALAGYTIGDATLYKDVRTLLPGRFVRIDDSGATEGRYHSFEPWRADQACGRDPQDKSDLAALTLDILQELIDHADGQMIALPLSAGLDSRLIASGLKHLGYRNVVCFAYGRDGNHEAEASRAIAERLGYAWHFVPFTNAILAKVFKSEGYARYKAYADSLTGVHFPQDYTAVTTLLMDGRIAQDAILVNGQSGDFLTGNHIPASLAVAERRNIGPQERMDQVVEALIAKHFKQWRCLMNERHMTRIGDMLRAEIGTLTGGALPDNPDADYGVYEVSEFVDRQSKYVVNGQRLYEFLGLDWSMPLWHDAYIDYWAARPLSQKARQRLYREMLEDENWAGVWRDIPVNEKAIRPRWVIPVRFAFKILHAPLGRQRWHRFERRFLEYFMTPLCGYAVRNWIDLALDGRGHWTAISPHIEDYLLDHGVSLDDLMKDVLA